MRGFRMPLRGEPLDFTFNGRTVRGYKGDTIATALARDGVKSFSRSMKFHRPRGLYCGSGRCISCVMRVNGVPGVRTCGVPLEPGMLVQTERGFPTTRFDALSVFDSVFRRQFDYHSRFIRPAFMTPLYQFVVRRLASSGRVPDSPGTFPPLERKSCEVLIIGRGISGSVAQARIQKAGVRSLIIADRHVGDVSAPPSTAFGFYESGEVGIQVGSGLQLIKARSILLAAGRAETGLSIVNGDIPGNVLPEAIHQLTSRGISPGARAVFVGTNELADRVRKQLEAVHSSIVAEVQSAKSVVQVLGRKVVKGIEYTEGGASKTVKCDLVVQFGPLVPMVELAQQAGCQLRSSGSFWNVKVDAEGRTSVPGMYACGGITGLLREDERIASGEAVALSMLRNRGGT
jgi:sarcosine oxidase subunit alpha